VRCRKDAGCREPWKKRAVKKMGVERGELDEEAGRSRGSGYAFALGAGGERRIAGGGCTGRMEREGETCGDGGGGTPEVGAEEKEGKLVAAAFLQRMEGRRKETWPRGKKKEQFEAEGERRPGGPRVCVGRVRWVVKYERRWTVW
jgi:hypothetical protein